MRARGARAALQEEGGGTCRRSCSAGPADQPCATPAPESRSSEDPRLM